MSADPFRHLSLGTRLTIDPSSFWQILVALHRLVSSCPTSWSRICTHCPPTEFLPQNPSHKSLTQNSFHNPSLTPITSHPSTNQTLNCRFIIQILLFWSALMKTAISLNRKTAQFKWFFSVKLVVLPETALKEDESEIGSQWESKSSDRVLFAMHADVVQASTCYMIHATDSYL